MMNYDLNIKRCVDIYGLSEEEATRIIKSSNDELSIQDLRYKYDNIDLGVKYPEWITPDEHLKICYKTALEVYKYDQYKWFYGTVDLAHDLFIWSSVRMSKFNDFGLLKHAVKCRAKTLLRDMVKTSTKLYNSGELYGDLGENLGCVNSVTSSYYTVLHDIEFVESIRDIKDYKARAILLLCSYFALNIDICLEAVVELYIESPIKIKSRIYEIGKTDEAFCMAVNEKYVANSEYKSIPVGKIFKIFGKQQKHFVQTFLKPYLAEIGFLPA